MEIPCIDLLSKEIHFLIEKLRFQTSEQQAKQFAGAMSKKEQVLVPLILQLIFWTKSDDHLRSECPMLLVVELCDSQRQCVSVRYRIVVDELTPRIFK